MVACYCGKRLTPSSKEIIDKARVRAVYRDIDGRRHDHSADTATLIWSCPAGHDLVVRKPMLCWECRHAT